MLSSFLPKSLAPSSRNSKRLAKEFSDLAGLVYFGYVSQRDDDHHIIRGVTVSNRHRDDHYCIGTYEGYDVIFVERTDTLHSGKSHVWHIIEVDLKSKVDTPHMFISSHNRTVGFHELLKTKYHAMLPHTMGITGHYPTDFVSEFSVNVTPAHAIVAEQLVTPEIADKIAAHFKGITVEITNDALYMYSEKAHITPSLLMTILANGVWLAGQLDKNSRQLQ